MVTDEEDLKRIEAILGRRLDADELGTYDSVAQIPKVVEATTAIIAVADLVLASMYLHDRAPSAEMSEIKMRLAKIAPRT